MDAFVYEIWALYRPLPPLPRDSRVRVDGFRLVAKEEVVAKRIGWEGRVARARKRRRSVNFHLSLHAGFGQLWAEEVLIAASGTNIRIFP